MVPGCAAGALHGMISHGPTMRLPAQLWFGQEWTLCHELHHIGGYRHRLHQRMPAHRAVFDELVVVVRGSLHLRLDGVEQVLLGGHMAAIRTGVEKELGSGPSRGRYLWIGIGDERHRRVGLALLDADERAQLEARLVALARTADVVPSGLVAACDRLLLACHAGEPGIQRRAGALAVLGELLAPAGARRGRTGLEPALDLIRNDPVAAASETLDQLAARCGLGLTTFKRRYLACTGLSPGDDIARRRMALAAPRLDAGEPVGTVARALGYASPAAFSAAWRRIHGRPPRRR